MNPLSIDTLGHLLIPPVHDTWPCWLGRWYHWRKLVYLQDSGTASPATASWWMETETSRTEPGPDGKANEWPDFMLFFFFFTRKSRVAAAVWALDVMVEQQAWVLWCGQCLHHSLKTLGRLQSKNQSQLAVFLSLRGMLATWPDLEKKHTTMYFSTLFDRLNFTCGASLGNNHTVNSWFVRGLYWKIHVSLPVTMSQT